MIQLSFEDSHHTDMRYDEIYSIQFVTICHFSLIWREGDVAEMMSLSEKRKETFSRVKWSNQILVKRLTFPL